MLWRVEFRVAELLPFGDPVYSYTVEAPNRPIAVNRDYLLNDPNYLLLVANRGNKTIFIDVEKE